MRVSVITRLANHVEAYLLRGCVDPTDPEQRRRSALHSATAFIGRLVALLFAVDSVVHANWGVALVLVVAAVAMTIAIQVHHRRKDSLLGGWMGVGAAMVLFLYLLATGGNAGTGHLWLPLLPLFAMFSLGVGRGAALTLVYLAASAGILFVPGVWGVTAVYEASFAARLLAATVFTALVAFYFEHSSRAAQARLRAEVEERRKAEAEAGRALAAKSHLLASVSHELRTPLTAVVGLHDLLLQTELTPTQRSYLEVAARSGRGLIALIGELLDLARLEAGKLELAAVPFDLRGLCDTLVDVQRLLAAPRALAVRLAWDEAVPGVVQGDPARTRQVLANLLGNAVKFTQTGSVVLRVRGEELGATAVTLRFEVEDTGPGLSAEQQAKVFEPFVQGQVGQEGSGLGLAIAKGLVEAMGGAIGVRSTVGEGSVFWCQWSFARSAAPAPEVASPALPAVRPGKVLLVEDNELNREVLRTMLERLGCTVDVAANGAEGVAACAARRYDLVLMDCRMPVLDGYAAAAQIRAAERGETRTPIVAVTAYSLPEDLRRCLAAGMDDQISKPIGLEALAALLERWLPGRASQRG